MPNDPQSRGLRRPLHQLGTVLRPHVWCPIVETRVQVGAVLGLLVYVCVKLNVHKTLFPLPMLAEKGSPAQVSHFKPRGSKCERLPDLCYVHSPHSFR
jgi:hypothetical protein